MKVLVVQIFMACYFFSFLASAQGEYIIHQEESPSVFDMKSVGSHVFIQLQYRKANGNTESFVVRGDKSMQIRDTLKLSNLSTGNLLLELGEPIGDTMFALLTGSLDTGQGYESELIFADTNLNVISRRALPPTQVLPFIELISGDSLIYLIGGDVLNSKDFYIGKYSIKGDLIKDTIYPNSFYALDDAVELDKGHLLLFDGFGNRLLVDRRNLKLDTVFGYGSLPVHKVFPHPNGYFYVTGWTQPRGSNPIEIGIFVNKVDSAGNLVDSAAFTNFNGFDVQTIYREGCILKSGDLLLPFIWDTTISSCLKIMIVDENLQLKKTITRYFGRDIRVVSSVAVNDGGAAILGEIQDTVDGGYDTYYLYIDSLGNFSPLTIFDNDAPNSGQLSLYPNPADDAIFIKGLDDQAVIDVFVTDVSGALVAKKELAYPFRLETNHLVSGVYSLLVADRRGNSFTLKMIKN